MITEVYDIEVLANCFTYTSYCLQEKKIYAFTVHRNCNEFDKFIKHITRGINMMVGFNNNKYDYPVIHELIKSKDVFSEFTIFDLTDEIYRISQKAINDEQFYIPDYKKYIPQTDLFQIWHFNNKGRSASLKSIEFALRMDNVEDMPFEHFHHIQQSDLKLLLDYNKNDVIATTLLLYTTLGITDHKLYKGKNKIQLRTNIQEKFRFPCNNLPDVQLGEKLLLELYCRETGHNKYDVSQLRTSRTQINLKDCVPAWYKFGVHPEFKELEDIIEKTTVNPELDVESTRKKQFEYSLIYHGIKLDFGLGGLHACIKPGVYESTDDLLIYDVDVASLHPSTAKLLGLFPQHLGPKFTELYSGFIDRRLEEKAKPKTERDNVLIEGYKLLLNGTYGKSKDAYSFLYDPLYTYKTTLGGEFLIAYWAKLLVEACPELIFLQLNTDGITMVIPKDKLQDLQKVNAKITSEIGYEIEDTFYDKMVIRDVSNYIAKYNWGGIKYKGCFEVDKEIFKDNSMRIVPIALEKYFIEGIPIEQTIRNHTDIMDFAMMLKINKSSTAYFTSLTPDKTGITKQKLSRITRYLVTKYGGGLSVFYNGSTSEKRVVTGNSVTLFNKKFDVQDFKDYNIDYLFYEREARKIINTIENKQLMF